MSKIQDILKFGWKILSGTNIPTVPTSEYESDGTWINTDLYDGQLATNKDTGAVYVRSNTDIIEVGSSTVTNTITKEPTGFRYPSEMTVSYNDSDCTITLSGNVEAYCCGRKNNDFIDGWISPPLTDTYPTPNTLYYLYCDSITHEIVWNTNMWHFQDLQIAYVYYRSDGTFIFALRECHGFMQWQTHTEFHYQIGTTKRAGNGLTNYIVNSTTAANRRPDTRETTLQDEDLTTVNFEHTDKSYSQAYMLGTANTMLSYTEMADIVPLDVNRPLWNHWAGTEWKTPGMSNNSYMCVWQIAMPTTADDKSQKLRYFWVTGQSNGTLASQRALGPLDVNLGNLEEISPEFVFINKVIIQYTANNWTIIEVENITGNNRAQVSAPAGNYLTVVSTDNSLQGNGTLTSPLGFYRVLNNTEAASALNVGGLRYRTSGNNSYIDVCMQIGASTYSWVNIIHYNW